MTKPPAHRLLQSKLTPPGIASKSLPRTALLERLKGRDMPKAVLLEAPAGYGKTTLMEQLFHEIRASGVNVAWLALDAYDDEPAELGRYLLRMLQDARLLPPGAPADPLVQTASPRTVLGMLLSEAPPPHGATFFIDDLHTLTTPDCLALIRVLIAETRHDIRFVMSSRGRPHLDVSKLVVQGKLTVLTAADIGFSGHEIALLLESGCPEELASDLFKSTQGWPVAVKLLQTLASHDPQKLQELIADIAAVPDVADYLTEQVMSHLTPDVQGFLMVTSVPAYITGDLANRLCDRTDGWRALRNLEHDGLFVGRDPADADCYRYYAFFRDYLRRRLHESTLDVRALHKRAAEFFLGQARFEDALQHSIEAAEWEMAIRILEQEGGWHLGLRLGGGALRGVQSIPEPLVQRSFAARLTLIYLLLHVGQTDSARERFEQLRTDSAEFTTWQGAAIEHTLNADCRALEAILVLSEERLLPVEFVERLKADARALGARGHFVRIVAEGSLTIYAYFDAGRYRECIRIAEESLTSLQRIKADFGLGYLYMYFGMCHLSLGRAQLARSWYDKVFDLATRRFPHDAQRLEAIACIAEVQYFQDDLEGARKNIAAVMAGLSQQSEVDSFVCHGAYLIAAALHARAGNLDATLSAFREARAIARYLQRDRRVAVIDIQCVEELTRAGFLAEAEEVIRGRDFQQILNERDQPPAITLLALQASIALAHFELQKLDPAGAVARLSAVQREAEPLENEIVKLKCLILLAAAQFAAELRAESTQTLRTLCSRIIPTGMKQLLIQEQALIQPALDFMIEQGVRSGSAAHANALLIAETWLRRPVVDGPAELPTPSVQDAGWLAAAGVLSPRQREVLELLAAGLSGKEIAKQLSLAESTIKSYRKTLYVKLRAGRRSQALANARRMLLLNR